MHSDLFAVQLGDAPEDDITCDTDLDNPGEVNLLQQEISRRRFVRWGLGSLASLIAMRGWSDAVWDQVDRERSVEGGAEHCIVLFMNGGPSQLDTFDPKPGVANGGPVQGIRTTVPGIQFSEYLPQLAEQAHYLAVIRSMATREGNHERARYLLHTGYPPTNSITHPTFGSIVSYEVGDPAFDLPNCISVNAPSPTAGFLGADHDPFVVRDPMKPIDDLKYPEHVNKHRFQGRLELMSGLSRAFTSKRPNVQVQGHQAIYEKAGKLINSERIKAFDLNDEPLAIREAYGMNRFGQGCLMARRLVEVGVKFVEVTLNGWDTHDDNFGRTKGLTETLDPAFATLIRDLQDRDLLRKTLVVWMGEFGRTPRINQREGRDHFPNGWSTVVAGGGVHGGQVIGGTDENGENVLDYPVTVPDLLASLCHAMGIDPTIVNQSSVGRPIQVVNDGILIDELFST